MVRHELTYREMKENPGCDVYIDGIYCSSVWQLAQNRSKRKADIYRAKELNERAYRDALILTEEVY